MTMAIAGKRGRLWLGLLGVGGCLAVLAWWVGWRVTQGDSAAWPLPTEPPPGEMGPETVQQINRFCGDCHRVPDPGSFPRDVWHTEVQQGYKFYAQLGRTDLEPPPMHLTVAYFRSRAPSQLAFSEPEEAEAPLTARFLVERITEGRDVPLPPAIAQLKAVPLGPDGSPWLENRGDWEFAYHRLAAMVGAYRALPGDMDLDGDLDIVVVAWVPQRPLPLGAVSSASASVLCLEQTSPGEFACHTLERGFPHYATLEVADWDGDGDWDFAVGPHVLRVGVSSEVAAPGNRPEDWLVVWWNQMIWAGP